MATERIDRQDSTGDHRQESFAGVTLRPVDLDTFGTLSSTEWAARQFTGSQRCDVVLQYLCSTARTSLHNGPPWFWDGRVEALSGACGMSAVDLLPLLGRLNQLGITRFGLDGQDLTTDIGRYAYQGDHVRRYGPPYPAVPEWMRLEIFRRDRHKCVHCGTGADLAIDHIEPRIYGGRNTLGNLQLLCRSCNSSKGVRTR